MRQLADAREDIHVVHIDRGWCRPAPPRALRVIASRARTSTLGSVRPGQFGMLLADPAPGAVAGHAQPLAVSAARHSSAVENTVSWSLQTSDRCSSPSMVSRTSHPSWWVWRAAIAVRSRPLATRPEPERIAE